MNKYEILLKVLDDIRIKAIHNEKFYLPELGKTNIDNARSRAFIHFFLKSYFGVLDFKERENLITDAGMDGGVDSYFINKKDKIIYLIQTKFKTNSKGYEKDKIENKELWKMDLERIVSGETKDSKGNNYNKKILKLQKEIRNLEDKSEYKYTVIIVANVKEIQKKYILDKYFTKKWNVEIFDYTRVYDELLFPYIRDDFFNENKISLSVVLSSTDKKPIHYEVKTEYGPCTIFMLLVPTEEIAKVLYKYKNSILKYNPRTYLGMKSEGVNKDIENSILNKKTNDFVLLNNGITIFSSESSYTENTGKKKTGEITIKDPQIINGGQTSYALSHIYERLISKEISKNPFKGKEVLLKVIVQSKKDKYQKITDTVSLSTNNQTSISVGDLKSNESNQIELQEYIFKNYGLLYERKKGEFYNSINKLYVRKDTVINRNDFIKVAYSALFPNIDKNPKNFSEKNIFNENIFSILRNNKKYKNYMEAYLVYCEIQKIKKQAKKPKNKWFISKCGNALRYGDLAVTIISYWSLSKRNKTKEEIKNHVENTLDKWLNFEKKSFYKKTNERYFDKKTGEYNPAAYYKSDLLIKDLKDYFVK